jgi:hypothetical protein
LKRLDYILLIAVAILFLGSWIICDIIYWEKAKYWKMLFEPLGKSANPYIKSWSLLRWKLFGLERVGWMLLLLPFSVGKFKNILVILLDFALGNLVDRVFFQL